MKKHLSNCTPLWFLLLTCLVLLVVSSRIAKADACVDTMYASDGTPMERINGATCNTTGGGITYHPGQTCGSNIPVCYRSAGGVYTHNTNCDGPPCLESPVVEQPPKKGKGKQGVVAFLWNFVEKITTA